VKLTIAKDTNCTLEKQAPWRFFLNSWAVCYACAGESTEGGRIGRAKALREAALAGFAMLFEVFIAKAVKAMPVHPIGRTIGSFLRYPHTLVKNQNNFRHLLDHSKS